MSTAQNKYYFAEPFDWSAVTVLYFTELPMKTFIDAITLDYILLCITSAVAVAYAMYRVLNAQHPPAADDDDFSGGYQPPLPPPDNHPTHTREPEMVEEEVFELAEF